MNEEIYNEPTKREEKRVAAKRTLNAEEQAVEAAAMLFWEQNKEALIESYHEEYGNILDTDRAKELFPMFTESPEARVALASAMYRPASQAVDEIYERLLRVRPGEFVVFLGGGPGSGKTVFSNTKAVQKVLSKAAAVMDGTMANQKRTEEQIEAALRAGKAIIVFYIFCKFERAIEGVIDRACSPKSLRAVPMSVVAGKHYEAANTLIHLVKKYELNDSVEIEVSVFNGPTETFGETDSSTVEKAMKGKTVDALTGISYRLLDARRERDQQNPEAAKAKGISPLTETIYQILRC